MGLSSIIYGRQEAQRWDTTVAEQLLNNCAACPKTLAGSSTRFAVSVSLSAVASSYPVTCAEAAPKMRKLLRSCTKTTMRRFSLFQFDLNLTC